MKLILKTSSPNYKLKFFFLIFFLTLFLVGLVSSQESPGINDLRTEFLKNPPDKSKINSIWNELDDVQRNNFWNLLDDEEKKKLWKDFLDENGKKKLLEAFDSDEKAGKKYLDLLDMLDTTFIKINNEYTTQQNEFLKLLNNKQAETLLSEATGKTVRLSDNIEGDKITYKSLLNKKYDTFQIKDPSGKEHFIHREEALPSKVEKIVLDKYNNKYYTYYLDSKNNNERKNMLLLESGYYVKKSEDTKRNAFGTEDVLVERGNEWLVESSDLTKRMTIGLDKKSGQIEIDEKGKIQMWGTPSLTGDEGMYVKIGDKKFFPHPDGPITEDKKYNYAFVNQLEDDVFNVKGNIQTKQIGMYIHDTDEAIVSFKDESKISSAIDQKNLITVSESTLGVSGDFRGKLSFAVSDDTRLIMSNSEFKIENKNGENYYTYLVEGGDVGRGVTEATENGEWELTGLERLDKKSLEFVSRTTENFQVSSDEVRVKGEGKEKDTFLANRVPGVEIKKDPLESSPPPLTEGTTGTDGSRWNPTTHWYAGHVVNSRYVVGEGEVTDASPKGLDIQILSSLVTRDKLIESLKAKTKPENYKTLDKISTYLPSGFNTRDTISIRGGGAGSERAYIEIWDRNKKPYNRRDITGNEAELVIKLLNNGYNQLNKKN